MLLIARKIDCAAEHVEYTAINMPTFVSAERFIQYFGILADKIADPLDAKPAQIGSDAGPDARNGFKRLALAFQYGTHRHGL